MLFADIASSTQLYDVLGDKRAQHVISSCLSLLSKVVERHEGKIIKTIGDEIMCIFPGADNAVEAGKDMHKSMAEMTLSDKHIKLPNLYVGMHYGPVIMRDSDVFGDTVNVAARVVKLAKQRQILITEEMVNLIPQALQSSVRFLDVINIKGKVGGFRIYEFIWETDDVTMMIKSDKTGAFIEKYEWCMELTLQDKIMRIDQNHPGLSLGRQPHNDIIVNTSSVSRSHARIEFRRGKFFLIDLSSNGSYVSTSSGTPSLIKKEEVQLKESGVIFLGKLAGVDSSEAIHFKIKSNTQK